MAKLCLAGIKRREVQNLPEAKGRLRSPADPVNVQVTKVALSVAAPDCAQRHAGLPEAYRGLCRQVRNAPDVTGDEVGWRANGPRSTPANPGRGVDDAASVLGTDCGGVLVGNGWQCGGALQQGTASWRAMVSTRAGADSGPGSPD